MDKGDVPSSEITHPEGRLKRVLRVQERVGASPCLKHRLSVEVSERQVEWETGAGD